MIVLTTGYAGHSPSRLKEIAERDNALVMDIRYRPVSKAPMWCGAALVKLLGDRYTQNSYWGNKRYLQGPPIQINSLPLGLKWFYEITEQRKPDAVILLCKCRSETECHRGVIARYLREQGLQVRELEWTNREHETREKEPLQPSLF